MLLCRFYTALALQELVNEKNLTCVAQRYKCTRGLLQSLQQMASTFAGIVTAFCNALNWEMLALIIGQFKERLYFGIHRDLIDLMRIGNLTSQLARTFYNSGIQTLIDLANGNVFDIETILYNNFSFDMNNQEENKNGKSEIRHIYVTGKSGLTAREMAKLLIDDARNYLEQEIGLKGGIKWVKNENPINSTRISQKKLSLNHVEADEINLPINSTQNAESGDMFLNNVPKKATIHNKSSLSQNNLVRNYVLESQNQKMKYPNNNGNNLSPLTIVDSLLNVFEENRCKIINNTFTKLQETTKQVVKQEIQSKNSQTIIINEDNPMRHQTINVNEMDSIDFSIDHLSHKEVNKQINSLDIVDVFGELIFFQNFTEEIKKKTEFAMSVGVEQIFKTKPIIGENLLVRPAQNTTCKYNLQYDDKYYVACISICLDNRCVYYFNLQNDCENNANEIKFKEKIDFLQKFLLQRTNIKIQLFNAKDQLKILHRTLLSSKSVICSNIEDPKIADWLLLQPVEEKTLFEMV